MEIDTMLPFSVDWIGADLLGRLSDGELRSYHRLLLGEFSSSCAAERDVPTGFLAARVLHVRLREAEQERRRRQVRLGAT
jgi:hypothetical protein